MPWVRLFPELIRQVFIFGPDFWNISYDILLRTELHVETRLVGDADNIAARYVEPAQLRLVMGKGKEWIRYHGIAGTQQDRDSLSKKHHEACKRSRH